ncbi:uncharacterized [Lates japonicus]
MRRYEKEGDCVTAGSGCQRTVCSDRSCYCGLHPQLAAFILLILASVPFHSEASLIQMKAVEGHSSEDQVMLRQSGKVLIT